MFKLRNSIILFLLVLSFSCSKEFDKKNDSTQLSDGKVLKRILDLGFSKDDIVEFDEYYLVEGDIVFSKNDPTLSANNQNKQARTNNIVTERNVRVFLRQNFSTLNSKISTALDDALSAYNELSPTLYFSRIYDENEANVVVSMDNDIRWDPNCQCEREVCGRGGFPFSNGQPFNSVLISEKTLVNHDVTSNGELKFLLAHELGHNIGLRHTNWSQNESAGSIGAVQIAGTPASDSESIMNSSTCGYSWGDGFSKYDKIAIYELYKPVESIGSVSSSTKFYFADINGDGMDDKIYWKYDKHNGDIRVALATGGGSFNTTYIHSSGSTSSSTKFYFADIDGDGKDDKIYWKYNKHDGDIRVALATGSGSFNTTYKHSSGSTSSSTKFYFADIDGDGKDDKIYWKYNKHSGDVRVALATGSGSFKTTYKHSSGSTSNSTKFYFADIDGNGMDDKIYWKYDKYSGDIRVALAIGAGSFKSTYAHSSGSTSTSTKFYFADIDGNGMDDKIYWKYDKYNGDTRVFLSNSNGSFQVNEIQNAGSSLSNTKIYYADIDGNQNIDRISWNYDELDGYVRVYLGQ